MFLKRCEIVNFRSIENVTINFDTRLQILLGLNEAGKSNVLKALSLLDPEGALSKDDVRDPLHNEDPTTAAEIRFVFGSDANDVQTIAAKARERIAAKKTAPVMALREGQELTLQDYCDRRGECLYCVDLIQQSRRYSYWSVNQSEFKIAPGWFHVPDKWASEGVPDGVRMIWLADYPDATGKDLLRPATIKDLAALVGNVQRHLLEEQHPKSIVWRYNEKNLLPGKIELEQFKANPNSCEPLKNIFALAKHPDPATSITAAQGRTNGVTNLLRALSATATKHLKTVWPEYSINITLKENGAYIDAGVEDDSNFFSFDRRSDGFKRFITFLLMISAKAKTAQLKDALLLMDEPDIGLHPSGVRYLLKELLKVSKANLVLCSTHSIFLIDKERIDRHLIVRKKGEKTVIEKNPKTDGLDEEVLYTSLGYSVFELLKASNIVFEGWYDKKVFRIWLESQSKKDRMLWSEYGLIHSGGASDIPRVATQLENLERNYVILSDADKPSLQAQKNFQGQGKWCTFRDLGFTTESTIEDFLHGDVVDRALVEGARRERPTTTFVPTGTTFEEKVAAMKVSLGLNDDEVRRVKRAAKDQLYGGLTSDHIASTFDGLMNNLRTHSGAKG